jgi:hypothetical protein
MSGYAVWAKSILLENLLTATASALPRFGSKVLGASKQYIKSRSVGSLNQFPGLARALGHNPAGLVKPGAGSFRSAKAFSSPLGRTAASLNTYKKAGAVAGEGGGHGIMGAGLLGAGLFASGRGGTSQVRQGARRRMM